VSLIRWRHFYCHPRYEAKGRATMAAVAPGARFHMDSKCPPTKCYWSVQPFAPEDEILCPPIGAGQR